MLRVGRFSDPSEAVLLESVDREDSQLQCTE